MKKAKEVDPIYIQFVQEFKKQIALSGLTLVEVADMLDTSETNLHNWLYFKRQMMGEFVVKIGKIFNIDFNQFELKGDL